MHTFIHIFYIDNVNLNMKVLISSPEERPPLLKGHFSGANGVASQEGLNCSSFSAAKAM